MGVWWGSERGLGIPLHTTQTPPKHPRHPPQSQDISQTPSRTLRDSDQTHTRCPPDTLQMPSTPLPDPTRPHSDPSPHTPSQTPPPLHSQTPPQTPPRHPGPSFRVWAKTDGAGSLPVLAKLLDTQTLLICQMEAQRLCYLLSVFYYNLDTLF